MDPWAEIENQLEELDKGLDTLDDDELIATIVWMAELRASFDDLSLRLVALRVQEERAPSVLDANEG